MTTRYRALVKKIMGPLPGMYGTQTVQRLLGFYVVWHLFGGEANLRAAGWQRTAIWRNRRDFSKVFGVEVEHVWPELAAKLEEMRDE
jgi:hypothetical protein